VVPEVLQRILDEVAGQSARQELLSELEAEWASHLAEVRQKLPGAHIEDEGGCLYLNDLSPGCRACKDGEWDCIFVTMECNLDCRFCWSPTAGDCPPRAQVLADEQKRVAEDYRQTHISGVSFSGGEAFMDVEELCGWVAWFKSSYPGEYYWVYTNGVLVTEESLARLAELGLDEIRFNAAATGYDDPAVLGSIAAAARLLPAATVEIPAIPEDSERVLSALEKWCAAGVRYLNLHELVYEPGSNSATMAGARRGGSLGDGHPFEYNPESRRLTLAVMEKVQERGLPLGVNDCSLRSKLRQIRGRRRQMAPLVKSPLERVVDGDRLERCCAYRGDEVLFFHPDQLKEMRERYPDRRILSLLRTVPLARGEPGHWVGCAQIGVKP